MGLFSRFFNKMFTPEPDQRRVTAKSLMESLSNNDVDGLPASQIWMHPLMFDLWRISMAEQLGREVRDTPMPRTINGCEIWSDDEQSIHDVIYKRADISDPDKILTRKIDILNSI